VDKILANKLRCEALRQIRAGHFTHRQFERHLGLRENALKGLLEAAVKSPNVDRAAEIARALGWEFYLGPKRDTGAFYRTNHEAVADRGAFERDFALIPRIRVEVGPDGARLVLGDPAVEPIAFRRTWLLDRNVRPADAVLVEARGESMEPTIHDGDLVLVDTARRGPPLREGDAPTTLGRLWAVRIGKELVVRRVERRPRDVVLLVGDNPVYGGQAIYGPELDDFEIVGEAIWWGHAAAPDVGGSFR
jgi:phage repressor protein C with HTH and peptisase S24 domain